MGARPDRRRFVLGLAGLAALARPLAARRAAPSARTLVLIQLTGGNDGLSTLVPYSDDAYARARDQTRFGKEQVLALDGRVGLHPELGRLRALYGEGRLALIEGIGYPGPDRSHFRSMDVWHSADPSGRGAPTGWIGRALERVEDVEAHAVVHFGTRPPYSLHSARRGALCVTPRLLKSVEPGRERVPDAAEAFDEPEGEASGALALVRERWQEARASTAELRAALSAAPARPSVSYPSSALARDLESCATLIHAELGVRVCSLEVDGFDTHRDQRPRHARRMAELDGALGAFEADLRASAAGRETLVVLFSEFGRRVEENASGGTDHGAAGLAMVMGARVKGGLYGEPPSLGKLEDGDLAFTTDFRRLYATCVRYVLGVEPGVVVGAGFEALGMV